MSGHQLEAARLPSDNDFVGILIPPTIQGIHPAQVFLGESFEEHRVW